MLNVQRRLAAEVLKCGKNRIGFQPASLEEIGEAITKTDIRALVGRGAVYKKSPKNTSRFWARHKKQQKKHGNQSGFGSRKGKKSARQNPKLLWMNKIRLQRNFIKSLRDKGAITSTIYHELYMKSKGGFFRSIRHLNLYIGERGISRK